MNRIFSKERLKIRASFAVAVMAIVVALGLPSSLPLKADMIDTSGLDPWETCALCHGLFGDSARDKFPKLAGQKPLYLTRQIELFRGEQRTNDGGQMQAMVAHLTDVEVAKIVAWFSTQNAPTVVSEKPGAEAMNELANALGTTPDLACGTCHQTAGMDKDKSGLESVPYLHAQHAAYLAKQMADFQSGERQGSETQHILIKSLSAAHIETLSRYFASLPRSGK